MALTGQLSDLSLTELIEFFCNQRKTGRLKVAYTPAPGFFYFQSGDLVDAKIGVLNGVDAVYFALTLHNASFKFSPSFATTRRTIHQPWTQVALEGLRRLDEGIKPEEAFVDGDLSYLNEPEYADDHVDDLVGDELAPKIKSAKKGQPVSPLSLTVEGSVENGKSRMPVYAAVAAAVVLIVAAVGFPAGWYSKKAAPAAAQQQQAAPQPEQAAQAASNIPGDAPAGQPEQAAPAATATDTSAGDAAALATRREREARERMKAVEKANAQAKTQDSAATATPAGAEAVKKPEAVKPGPKMASVQVTYDEAGRVTSASGGDSNAIRIARQKRFPAGKAGSTTVTIPIN